jgi:FixJ family two-component response regulator
MNSPLLPVAVVDDDPAFRRALERLLRGAGFEVDTFTSAEDYLARSGGHSHRCLVLDVFLGGMSGLDLRAELAQNGIRIPVVFITAHEDVGIVARAAPGVPCLRKPFDEELLFEAIAEVTGAQQPQ